VNLKRSSKNNSMAPCKNFEESGQSYAGVLNTCDRRTRLGAKPDLCGKCIEYTYKFNTIIVRQHARESMR
jgi:hypothetical protein